MAAIDWSLTAQRHLRDIVEYLESTSPSYAGVFGGQVFAAVELIGEFPRLGRAVPEYQDDDLREVLVGNYRLVYHLTGEHLGIVGIVHGSRDLRRAMGEEPWDLG